MSQSLKLQALRRISDYDGSTDVEQWIDRVEAASQIDAVPKDQLANVFIIRLDGAARHTWKAMPEEKRSDAEAIKAALRRAFGLQRFEAWQKGTASRAIQPGESIDAAFAEIRTCLSTATAGEDPISRAAACVLLSRLSSNVREQVLMHCGRDLQPSAVVDGIRSALSSASPSDSATLAACEPSSSQSPAVSAAPAKLPCGRCERCHRSGHQAKECRARRPTMEGSSFECWSCRKPGHMARNCPSNRPAGNASGGPGAPTGSPTKPF